ncbi:hypothetical protein [Streptomyces pristinaespiralis]
MPGRRRAATAPDSVVLVLVLVRDGARRGYGRFVERPEATALRTTS